MAVDRKDSKKINRHKNNDVVSKVFKDQKVVQKIVLWYKKAQQTHGLERLGIDKHNEKKFINMLI